LAAIPELENIDLEAPSLFAEFPKLFGRTFAIAFFLPATIFSLLIYAVLRSYEVIADYPIFLPNGLLGIGVAIFVNWLIAILMMALNRSLVRLLGGYGSRNPLQIGKLRTRRQFQRTIQPLFDEAAAIDRARVANAPEPPQSPNFAQRLMHAVANYPSDTYYVLPTRLGNIMRAFELYSFEVYGIDAIPAWSRLMMVLPDQARTQIQESRSILDFAINLFLASISAMILYVSMSIVFLNLMQPSVFVFIIFLHLIARFLMHQAARQWGEQVKSAFDLYRSNLANQMGLKLPSSGSSEREMWTCVNRMMLFRVSSSVIDQFRDRIPFEGNRPDESIDLKIE
jgi:hypothetical protein